MRLVATVSRGLRIVSTIGRRVELRNLRLNSESAATLPSDSRVVVCGGGIIGCSVAYHLAESGWSDVVLLEQGR